MISTIKRFADRS